MEPDIGYVDGKLTIDVQHVLSELGLDERRNLMEWIVLDDEFLEFVVKLIVEGSAGDRGYLWAPSRSELRLRLLPEMRKVEAAVIEDLVDALARSRKMEERYRNAYIQTSARWPGWGYDHSTEKPYRTTRPVDVDYHTGSLPSDGLAARVIAACGPLRGWIPVGERMPEVKHGWGKTILTIVDYTKDGGCRSFITNRIGGADGQGRPIWEKCNDAVTHWKEVELP